MWGPDVSVYQYISTDYKAMKANGATFGIARTGQSTSFYDANLGGHVNAIRAAGLKLGLYHWFDPNVSAKAQVDFMAKKIDQYKPDFICPDFEQWWKSWIEWDEAIRGIRAWDKVTRTDPNVISTNYKAINVLLHNLGVVLNYTGLWFVFGYAPNMLTWLVPEYKWYADYTFVYKFFGTAAGVNVTWEKFQILLTALTSPDCDVHQFGSTVIIPATPGKTDLNKVISKDVTLLKILGADLPDPLTLESLNKKIEIIDERLKKVEAIYQQFIPVIKG
jgi:hypothetical protein